MINISNNQQTRMLKFKTNFLIQGLPRFIITIVLLTNINININICICIFFQLFFRYQTFIVLVIEYFRIKLMRSEAKYILMNVFVTLF
jgi:hypothetical protein